MGTCRNTHPWQDRNRSEAQRALRIGETSNGPRSTPLSVLARVQRHCRNKCMQICHTANNRIHGGAVTSEGSLDVTTIYLAPIPFNLDWCNGYSVKRCRRLTILYGSIQQLSSAKHPCATDHHRVLANHLNSLSRSACMQACTSLSTSILESSSRREGMSASNFSLECSKPHVESASSSSDN